MPNYNSSVGTEENHTLLLQLVDHSKSVESKMDTHIADARVTAATLSARIDQTQENARRMFDETQESSRKMIESIKDSLASKGKITSGSMFAFIAVMMSSLALVGGVVQAYVAGQIATVRPIIDSNTSAIYQGERERLNLREQLHQFEIEAVKSDATSAESRRWIENKLESLP